MSQKDYYQVLGVDSNSPQQGLKDAYRKLALQYHPDRNAGDAAAVEKMKELNEAYAVLSDPEKRSKYDRLRQQYGPSAYDRFRQTHSDEDIFRGSDINQVFGEMARTFGFRNFEEVFREAYGQGYHTFEFRKPGVYGRGYVFYGGRGKDVRGQVPPSAGMFQGYIGKMAGYFLKKMLGVEGYKAGEDLFDVIMLNPAQAGEGGKVSYFDKKQGRELLLTIPAGTRDGQVIRLRGMGTDGVGGGQPGDLYLKVTIKKPLLEKIKAFLKI